MRYLVFIMKKATLHFVLVYLLMQWGNVPILAGGAGSFLPFVGDHEITDRYKTSTAVKDTLGFTQLPVDVTDPEDCRREAFYTHACAISKTAGAKAAMEEEFTRQIPLVASYKKLFEDRAAGKVRVTDAEIAAIKPRVVEILKGFWVLSEKGYYPAANLLSDIFFKGLCGMPVDKAVGAALCDRPKTWEDLYASWDSWQRQKRLFEEAETKDIEKSDGESEEGAKRLFAAYGAVPSGATGTALLAAAIKKSE